MSGTIIELLKCGQISVLLHCSSLQKFKKAGRGSDERLQEVFDVIMKPCSICLVMGKEFWKIGKIKQFKKQKKLVQDEMFETNQT